MLLINIFGLLLIGFIVWWFWLYKPKEFSVTEKGILVTVENGTYSPSRIKLIAGKTATIQFLRKDDSPCSATVLIPDFEISKDLPLNKKVSVLLPKMNQGEYAFHCQMQMYKGSLFVE